MTTTTAPPTSPDCGPRFRLSIGDGPFRRWFCLNAEHGCGYTDREEEAQWFSASEVMAAVACLHDVLGDHSVLLTPEPAPQPEQPAPPTPVAPTEPGLYPLADGSRPAVANPSRVVRDGDVTCGGRAVGNGGAVLVTKDSGE